MHGGAFLSLFLENGFASAVFSKEVHSLEFVVGHVGERVVTESVGWCFLLVVVLMDEFYILVQMDGYDYV